MFDPDDDDDDDFEDLDDLDDDDDEDLDDDDDLDQLDDLDDDDQADDDDDYHGIAQELADEVLHHQDEAARIQAYLDSAQAESDQLRAELGEANEQLQSATAEADQLRSELSRVTNPKSARDIVDADYNRSHRAGRDPFKL